MSHSLRRCSGIRENFARQQRLLSGRFSQIALLCGLLLLSTSRLHAAAPTLDALYPAGGQPGQSVTATIVGKSDPWPVSTWCSHPGIKISTDKEKKGQLILAIPADAVAGPVLVRLFNAEGASEPRPFIIGPKGVTELSEVEPNSSLRQTSAIDPKAEQPPALPLILNGRLSESADVDLFPLDLKKGQTLSAAADAYALGSPIDPHLVLYGPPPRHEVIAIGNDGSGTLDPHLSHSVEADGQYLIGIMGFAHPPGSSISFTSNAKSVYRLTLTTGPWLTHSDPSAVQATKPSQLKLHGAKAPLDVTVPACDAKREPGFRSTAPHPRRFISHPTFANTIAIPVVDLPLQAGEKLTLPAAASGTLTKPGETDAFGFTAKKGDKIQFKLRAHYLASDLDPVLIIENAEGKELKRADDTKPTVDAELLWTSPADGDYIARIADVIGGGSDNHRYLLTAETSAADFSATVAASKFDLKAGDKTEITVKLTRSNGHNAALEAKVESLPAGVQAEVEALPEKTGDFKITLQADDGVKATSQPLRLTITEKAEGTSRSKPALFTFVGADWRGPYLVEETQHLWLTLMAKPEEKKKEEAAKKDEKK